MSKRSGAAKWPSQACLLRNDYRAGIGLGLVCGDGGSGDPEAAPPAAPAEGFRLGDCQACGGEVVTVFGGVTEWSCSWQGSCLCLYRCRAASPEVPISAPIEAQE